MAQTLEEFLVSIKYSVDQGSQQRFFETLKRTAQSVGGVTAEITLLTLGVVAFAERMAKTGDALYWMSSRLGDSIANIQATAQAMSTLGMTSGEAQQNMEKFGFWLRSYGPAATGFLRTLGVTATDTTTAMEQLGRTLYQRGLRPGMERTQAYAMQLQYLNLIPGMTEQFVRTIPQHMARIAAMASVASTVWGGAGAAQQGQQQFGAQSNQMILQFARLESLFINIAEKMALNIFPAVSHFIDEIIAYGPRLVEIFDGISKGLGMFVGFVAESIHFFHELPGAIQAAAAIFLTLPTAVSVLLSPLGMVIAGFTALFILMDDYKHWQEDQRTHSKFKHSLFDWGDDTMFGKVKNAAEAIGQFAIDHPWMTGVLAGIAALITKFGLLGRAMMLTGLAGPIAAAIGAAIAIHEYESPETGEAAKKQFGADTVANRIKAMINNIIAGITGEDPAAVAGRAWEHPMNQATPGTAGVQGLPGGPSGPPSRLHPPRKGWWGPNFLNPEYWNNPQLGRQHSELTRGSYQLASLGDSWMPPSAFGGGGSNDDTDLFKMLKIGFVDANQSLGDILRTLQDMALTMGSGDEARTGTGSYGEAHAGVAATSQEQVEYANALAKRLNIPPEAAAAIVSNMMAESGLDPHATSSSGAHGGAQWIRSRWGPLAAYARTHGFDPETKGGNQEMLAHDLEANFPGLLAELKAGGDPTQLARRFFYEFEAVHFKPLLTPQNWASHTGLAGPLAARMHGNTYNTTVTVTAPNPASAAHQTADAVKRVHEEHSRMTTSAYR